MLAAAFQGAEPAHPEIFLRSFPILFHNLQYTFFPFLIPSSPSFRP